MTQSHCGVLQIFCKAPIVGQVKTRLIASLGEVAATTLHVRMASNTFAMSQQVSDIDVQLWCSPDTHHLLFQQAVSQHSLTLHAQHGDSLGERMAFALNDALKQYQWVLLIGTDCPAIDAAVIDQARHQLESGSEVVFGPAADGGFYLVGLRHYPEQLFAAMRWGHSGVMQEIASRLQIAGVCPAYLATLNDLDRPEDLAQFPQLLKQTGIDYVLD